MILFDLFLAVLAIPVLGASLYLAVLTLLSWRNRLPPAPEPKVRFAVVVPAHDEAAVIERTVRSLRALDWPADLQRLIVVADNCSDATATLAATAGATVWERHDLTLRGKGYALEFAFQRILDEDLADAIAVVDADTEVTPNLLRAFAARITQGEHAVQSHYGVLNPWDSWRTQLVTIAMAAFHIVRSRTRERLGVSSGIRGNGWCLTCDLLRKVPYRAYSLAEDLEFGITLGLAGFRVAYADDAHVYGEMVSSASVAQRQRQRWESGRFELIRSQTPRLLAAALRRRSGVCLELALDLLLLPLSYLVMGIGLFTAAAVVLSPWSRFAAFWLWAAGACILILAAHVLRGWQVSGLGARGLLTLARVPGFLVWKILLSGRSKPTEWVRTDRESR